MGKVLHAWLLLLGTEPTALPAVQQDLPGWPSCLARRASELISRAYCGSPDGWSNKVVLLCESYRGGNVPATACAIMTCKMRVESRPSAAVSHSAALPQPAIAMPNSMGAKACAMRAGAISQP